MSNNINTYFGLKVQILIRLLLRRKFSLLKLWNFLICYINYFCRTTNSGKSPIVINFELWNECNESCLFCRDENDQIFNANPLEPTAVIPKGKLDYDTYIKVIDTFADRLILSIPYINGEPLLSKDIYSAIQAASDRGIGTLIASNGILLNEKNSRKLLDADLDCLKVHISGFTNKIHTIEHRKGDVERIKRNLIRFMDLRTQLKSSTIVMLDYIRYEHNKPEIELARNFARKHGILFNIRPGNPKGLEITEPLQSASPLPVQKACDWLWTVLTIDWNSSIYPCCDHVVWTGASTYGYANNADLNDIWMGTKVREMRRIHTHKGRTPIAICAQCPRQGVKFKW